MKKLYIISALVVILGISAGIFYFTVYRNSAMELPKDIVMTDISGDKVSFDTLPKKMKLIEFMYTNCPDICPVTTYKMKHIRDELVKNKQFGKHIEFFTITVDPKRDTEEALAKYADTFQIKKNDGWYVLRGTEADTKKLAKAFNFMYRDPGNGMLIHTSNTYLLDENNRLVQVFGMGESGFDNEKVLKKIKDEID